MKLRALIADDEPLARERLRLLLASDEAIVVTAECRNGREVVNALRQSSFDVLFLDIRMPGGTGFEVMEQVGAANLPITVFVTAHNEFAIQAFEVNALDYLTKPVELPRLQTTLRRVKERAVTRSSTEEQSRLQAAFSHLETLLGPHVAYPQRLLVPHGNREVFVAIDDIDWIEAADYYASLHVGPRTYLIRKPIKDLAQSLDPSRFVRIHRSIIVNISRVTEIFREGRSEGAVVLSNGERLRMSNTGWQSLLAVTHK